MPKFTYAERRQIRDCLIQCRVKRFSRVESQAFIKANTHLEVSIRQIDIIIKDLKRTAPRQLDKLRESRYAFLDEVFKTKDEIEEYIREAWRLYHTSPNDPYLQLNCIKELHALSVTRSNIIDVLPHYSAMGDVTNGKLTKESVPSHILGPSQVSDSRARQAIF